MTFDFDSEWSEYMRLKAIADASGSKPCWCGKRLHFITCGLCGRVIYSQAHAIPLDSRFCDVSHIDTQGQLQPAG